MAAAGEEDLDAGAKKKKQKVKPGSFQGLGLGQATYKAIMKMGYKVPTPIQRKTIPTIMEGQDLVAMARTGSGKTAAFLIPIIEQLKEHSVAVGMRAVVLSPTRELAMQTAKFFRQLNRFSALRCCLLVGGQAMEAQFEHLANNPDVVIATPGRLMHHIVEAELSLSRVQVLVFDEADRLFELGFAEQLQKIMEGTPLSRQCLLFSATLPAQLVAFSRAGVKNPVFVRLDVETTLSDALDLWFVYVRKDEKLAAAIAILRRLSKDNKQTIMFVATRHHVEFFGELLAQLGFSVAIVYGAMDQDARTEQIARFRKKKASVLVTTDVAARGIDVPLLDHVLNFDFPPSSKLFVHRTGRTARAGRSGLAVSLVALDDLPYTVELMLFLGRKLVVADGSAAEKESGQPLLGAMPGLEDEVEILDSLLKGKEEDTTLRSLQKSMLASYNLYYKTRPSASKQSVARAKGLLELCGGPARLQGLVHPAFRDARIQAPGQKGATTAVGVEHSFVQELRSFRPKAEKQGNVISTGAMRTMEQAKQINASVSAARSGTGEVDSADVFDGPGVTASGEADDSSSSRTTSRKRTRGEESGASQRQALVVKDRPRMSKAHRKLANAKTATSATSAAATGAEDFAGWDVEVDGLDLGDDNRKKVGGQPPQKVQKRKGQQVEQFYLSATLDQSQEAKERGLDMEQYQMDLLPDDSTDIKKQKSVMRWDAKKKKYLPVMVSVDGRVAKGSRRNESGVKVKGEVEKADIYKRWAKATKKRIQKVGEMEQTTSDPLGRGLKASASNTLEFDDKGEAHANDEDGSRKRKPVVPFHGEVEDKYLTNKQKRIIARRQKDGSVVKGGKKELKTAADLQKQKKLKDRNKLKQKPWLRKEKAKQAKDARRKLMEERQMKNGARTKSKMLIFEGSAKRSRGKLKRSTGVPFL